MKSFLLTAMTGVVIAFTGCEKQQIEQATERVDTERQHFIIDHWYYVMDMSKSRDCTYVGGGVCFENPWGGNIIFATLTDLAVEEVDNAYENGGLFVSLIEQAGMTYMRVVLVREGHADGHVLIETDFTVHENLASELGVASITLDAGYYPLDLTTYTHGEVIVPCTVVPLGGGEAGE